MVDTEREVVRRRAGRTRQWMGRGCRRTLNTEAGAGMPEPLKELVLAGSVGEEAAASLQQGQLWAGRESLAACRR